jgi:hypothetical protein
MMPIRNIPHHTSNCLKHQGHQQLHRCSHLMSQGPETIFHQFRRNDLAPNQPEAIQNQWRNVSKILLPRKSLWNQTQTLQACTSVSKNYLTPFNALIATVSSLKKQALAILHTARRRRSFCDSKSPHRRARSQNLVQLRHLWSTITRVWGANRKIRSWKEELGLLRRVWSSLTKDREILLGIYCLLSLM